MSVFFYEPFYDFDRLCDETLCTPRQLLTSPVSNALVPQSTTVGGGAVRSFRPRMDLHEDTVKNIVTAAFEFPGVPKQDIQVDVTNGRLTVSAETKQSSDYEEAGYAVRERRFGRYARTLTLPEGIKEEQIKAHMDNGVLTVTFPRTTPELASKRITIA